MARLTEEMVIARSKQSDLTSVKKLNCWGAELGDVSLLRRMPNVEVLAFSVNKIRGLGDFAHCPRLRELYIRKNEIRDLTELRHLRALDRLTHLWLDENPCTEHPLYRHTVLRNLPNLEKLDDVPVHEDEVQEAMRRGLIVPDSDEEGDTTQECVGREYEPGSGNASPEPPSQPYAERDAELEPDYYYRRQDQMSPPRGGRSPEYEERYDPAPPPAAPAPAAAYATPPAAQASLTRSYYEPSRTGSGGSSAGSVGSARADESALRHSYSAQSVKEYAASNGGAERAGEGGVREYTSAVMAEHPRLAAFTRRPVTRNSNLLSAVLCLVKELDYPSLEVAEMAVRCRMDELANCQ